MSVQETLFALDCGATNWRLYRASYLFEHGKAVLVGEPQVSPLTSFLDRELPAAILLNPAGDGIDGFGEIAQQQLENEARRHDVREYFKPCIGAHLLKNPLPHQTRYSHQEALDYTRFLLRAVIDQIRMEKWRAGEFDERVWFTFAFPVHWRSENDGVVFHEFAEMVRSCFPKSFYSQIRFVAEPEGAILSLQRQGALLEQAAGKLTIIMDVGGSTTDIVAGRVQPKTQKLELLGRYGAAAGGGLYDSALAEHIGNELNLPEETLKENYAIQSILRSFGRRLKESLSRQQLNLGGFSQPPQRTISLVLEDGTVYRRLITLDESTFNRATAGLQAGFEALVERAMDKLSISEQEIGQVMLVGGGSQLFTVVKFLRQRFGEERVVLADNPSEIVVQGIGLEYGKSFEDYQPTIMLSVVLPLKEEILAAIQAIKRIRLVSDVIDFELEPENVYTLGRDRANQLHLNHPKISRYHAEFKWEDGGLTLTDLGSTNGSFLNDKKIPPNQTRNISIGDSIRFGDYVFTVEEDKG